MVFAQSIEARCSVENEEVVGAAPTGDAPTTSELSTILLPTKVRLILEVLRYISKPTFPRFRPKNIQTANISTPGLKPTPKFSNDCVNRHGDQVLQTALIHVFLSIV